MQGKTVGKKEK